MAVHTRKGRKYLAALAAIAVFSHPVTALTDNTVVIGNDRGGGLVERVGLIRNYRAQGTRVEIRGDYCLSACTLYLRLPRVCVAPDTVFGFHGPSSRFYGIALSPDEFERWSQLMARHYPEPLRSWFLKKGRYRTVGFFNYRGAELIDMGLPACPA